MTTQIKHINPAWVALILSIIIVVLGWTANYTSNTANVDTLKEDYKKHC